MKYIQSALGNKLKGKRNVMIWSKHTFSRNHSWCWNWSSRVLTSILPVRRWDFGWRHIRWMGNHWWIILFARLWWLLVRPSGIAWWRWWRRWYRWASHCFLFDLHCDPSFVLRNSSTWRNFGWLSIDDDWNICGLFGELFNRFRIICDQIYWRH